MSLLRRPQRTSRRECRRAQSTMPKCRSSSYIARHSRDLFVTHCKQRLTNRRRTQTSATGRTTPSSR
ncbi:hypothetical protein F444_05619 [Phytophthora nicotianae P1976]|uniref:Uncharacterized protein n=1 Tax=Phytophthora nicotianae P1976 TaxID=1317066 RepID=A0A081ALH8_PHYNI|nr:hypothetical protein F444_05619 [Phytophthora nicotianae P1976]